MNNDEISDDHITQRGTKARGSDGFQRHKVSEKGRQSYAGKVAIRKAAECAKEIGVDIGGFEVTPSGTIRILDVRAYSATYQSAEDEFEKWRAAGKLG